MKHKAKVTKVLLACGLLIYAASVFLPWLRSELLGGSTIYYWSFKAKIYPYPYPSSPNPYEVMFFDYWSWSGYCITIFAFQILTLISGLLALLKKTMRKHELVFLGLTLLFSAMSIGTCISYIFELSRMIIDFEIGFWTTSFAFLLLIASLSISLIK